MGPRGDSLSSQPHRVLSGGDVKVDHLRPETDRGVHGRGDRARDVMKFEIKEDPLPTLTHRRHGLWTGRGEQF